jgi:hypothetical protein
MVISAIRASRLFGGRGTSADVIAMRAADIAKDVSALKAASGTLRHGSASLDDALSSSQGSGVMAGAGGRRLSAGGGGSRLQRGASGAVPVMTTIDEQGAGPRGVHLVRSDSGVGAGPAQVDGSVGRRTSAGGESSTAEALTRVRGDAGGSQPAGVDTSPSSSGNLQRALGSTGGGPSRSSRRMWRKVRTAVRFSHKALVAVEAHASEGRGQRDTDSSSGGEGGAGPVPGGTSFVSRSSFRSGSTVIKASEDTCQRVIREAEVGRSNWPSLGLITCLPGDLVGPCQ